MALVDLTEQERDDIGRKIRLYIDAGLQVEGRMPRWWEAVERQYRNESPGEGAGYGMNARNKGYKQFHVPLSQPRLDMLAAQTTTVITKQNPFMTDMEASEGIAEPRQNLGHAVWKDAGFENRCREAATITGCTDLAYFTIRPNYAQRGALEMTVIHPDAVSVYPALPQGPQAATCVGNRLFMRRFVVESMANGVHYYDLGDFHLPSSTQDEYDRDYEQSHTGTELGDTTPDRSTDLLEMWPCVVRLNLTQIRDEMSEVIEEKLYWATIEYKSMKLLRLEEYNFAYIPYFRTQYIGSPRLYYSGESVGRNLYAPQDAYNTLWSQWFGGVMQAASGGPIFGEGLNSSEKFSTNGLLTLFETDSPAQPWQGKVQFDGAPFPQMLEKIERLADQIARVSQNTLGAQASGDPTATQQSIIAAGVAVGIEDFISHFTQDFPAMMALTMQIIADDYDAYAERYGFEMTENDTLMPQVQTPDSSVLPMPAQNPLPPGPQILGGTQ